MKKNKKKIIDILLMSGVIVLIIIALIMNKVQKGKNKEMVNENQGVQISQETEEFTTDDTICESESDSGVECSQTIDNNMQQSKNSVCEDDVINYLNKGTQMEIDENTDFSQFSAARIGYGFGNKRNEDNKPLGALASEDEYGEFAVDYIQPDSKYIFLTMDEGYEAGFTSSILDVLKEKNVSAVFFVTLTYAMKNPDLIERMIDEGHVIGNHSATHPSSGMYCLSIASQIKEIDDVTQYIKDNYNYDMYLFRFPAGIYSERSLAIVQSLGYRSVFWSFAYNDYDESITVDPDVALSKVVGALHGGAIYLLHPTCETNLDILPDFIDQARSQGYEFGYYAKMD